MTKHTVITDFVRIAFEPPTGIKAVSNLDGWAIDFVSN